MLNCQYGISEAFDPMTGTGLTTVIDVWAWIVQSGRQQCDNDHHIKDDSRLFACPPRRVKERLG